MLLMDCEGIDSVKGDVQHDAVVFFLSILLSEVLVFNCVGECAVCEIRCVDVVFVNVFRCTTSE